jgi:hypothetical protein
MKFTENKNSKSNQLDQLVSEQNIVCYRRLLDPELDVSRRRAILGLLKREFDKLRERPTLADKMPDLSESHLMEFYHANQVHDRPFRVTHPHLGLPGSGGVGQRTGK